MPAVAVLVQLLVRYLSKSLVTRTSFRLRKHAIDTQQLISHSPSQWRHTPVAKPYRAAYYASQPRDAPYDCRAMSSIQLCHYNFYYVFIVCLHDALMNDSATPYPACSP